MRRAVVIGSSDGIGLSVARALVERGWAVDGLSRSPSRLESPRYEHTVADVTAPSFRERLEALLASRKSFDVCVYSAGIGEVLDLDDLAVDQRVFAVNLMGALTTLEVVIPSMRRAGGGHVIVLSSQGDMLVSGAAPAYHASKAALSSYVEGLALALRGSGVAITNVRFGFVDTKMAKAPAKPFMITADKAARIVLRTLERRPVRVTHPLSMAAVVWLMAFATWLKIFWS